MRFESKEVPKFWDKIKCTFGSHKLKAPFFCQVYSRGKIASVPKNIGVQVIRECKFCHYEENHLTCIVVPYGNHFEAIKEMNRKKTKLERALK